MSVAQYSPSQITQGGQSSLHSKQVLKEIKENLEKEFTDIQQINQVIIKLAQRKNLSFNDLDAGREMMKINYKKNSLSVTKYSTTKKDTTALFDNNMNNTSLIQKIQPPTKNSNNLQIESDHQIAKSQTLNGNSLKPLKVRGNLSTNNRTKSKIVLPIIGNGAAANSNGFLQNDRVSDLMKLNISDMKNTERGQEVIQEQKMKLQDPWRLMINEDLSKYEQEKLFKLSTKRNSQSNYKEYLEKQIQSTQAQKKFELQVNLQEGDQIKNIVQKGDLQEREKFQNQRDKIKGIMKLNDQTKLSALQQQQKLKYEMQEKERKEAIDKDLRDLQQIKEEQMAIKLKQRKVSSDLDFIKSQHQQIKQSLQQKNKLNLNGDISCQDIMNKNGLNVSHSHTNKHSPRAQSSLDGDQQMQNPFVDKAGIHRHRSRIQELTQRNLYNMQAYDKYTVSPKEQSITKLESNNISFQTILDDRNKNYQNETKNLHKKYISDNQNLTVIKTKVKVENHQNEIDQELQLAKLDVENSLKYQQDAINEKIQKQKYVQQTLQDQIIKNKDSKLAIAKHGDLSPTEIALNKKQLQHIDIWNPKNI